jgi:hypothetical protein
MIDKESLMPENGISGNAVARHSKFAGLNFKSDAGKLEERPMKKNAPVQESYIRNPDVVLREEEADGGLLFNPDTNQIRVVNATGLLIWKLCDGKHGLADMSRALEEAFEGADSDQARKDVLTYIEDMKNTGFIGMLEPSKP